jgi:hypothetical protein
MADSSAALPEMYFHHQRCQSDKASAIGAASTGIL